VWGNISELRKDVVAMLTWETPDFVETLVNCECTAYASVEKTL